MLDSRYTIQFDLREPPGAGDAQIVFRCSYADRKLVQDAARLLGISLNRLMRTLVIQAAQQIMNQADQPPAPTEEVKFRVADMTLPPGVKAK